MNVVKNKPDILFQEAIEIPKKQIDQIMDFRGRHGAGRDPVFQMLGSKARQVVHEAGQKGIQKNHGIVILGAHLIPAEPGARSNEVIRHKRGLALTGLSFNPKEFLPGLLRFFENTLKIGAEEVSSGIKPGWMKLVGRYSAKSRVTGHVHVQGTGEGGIGDISANLQRENARIKAPTPIKFI